VHFGHARGSPTQNRQRGKKETITGMTGMRKYRAKNQLLAYHCRNHSHNGKGAKQVTDGGGGEGSHTVGTRKRGRACSWATGEIRWVPNLEKKGRAVETKNTRMKVLAEVPHKSLQTSKVLAKGQKGGRRCSFQGS